MIYMSKPQQVEAVQWTGGNRDAIVDFAGDKARFYDSSTIMVGYYLNLLAGKDGAQKWVPVPVGHWLVCQVDDKSDIWPIDPEYFENKYFVADRPRVPSVRLPDYEYAVMHPAYPDEPHRGPESLPWVRNWIQEAEDDGFLNMFYIARRVVGAWERFE